MSIGCPLGCAPGPLLTVQGVQAMYTSCMYSERRKKASREVISVDPQTWSWIRPLRMVKGVM